MTKRYIPNMRIAVFSTCRENYQRNVKKLSKYLKSEKITPQEFIEIYFDNICMTCSSDLLKSLISLGVKLPLKCLSKDDTNFGIGYQKKTMQFLLSSGELYSPFLNEELLIWACKIKWVELVEILIAKSEVNPSARDNQAVVSACQKVEGMEGKIFADHACKIVELLLTRKEVDPSDQDNEALILACKNNLTKVVKLLLKRKDVNPAAQNNKVLMMVCENMSTSIAKLLLKKKGVDPLARNNRALEICIKVRNHSTFEYLLNLTEIDPSIDDNKFFRLACKHKCKKTIEFLFRHHKTDTQELSIIALAEMICKYFFLNDYSAASMEKNDLSIIILSTNEFFL